MSKVLLQFMVKVNPGADLAKVHALTGEAMALWKKHGGQPSYWSVSAGEAGCLAVAVQFESFADYAKSADAVFADPAMGEWQSKATASGSTSWVRSNLLRQLG